MSLISFMLITSLKLLSHFWRESRLEGRQTTLQAIQVIEGDQVSPDHYYLISDKELERLREKSKAVEERESNDQWWVMDDLVRRYKCRPMWFTNNIFQNPRFEKMLRGQSVMYPGEGVKGYHCEPMAFAAFMRQWFPEIARAAAKGGKP
jgi:phage pi2 protein 07